MTPEQLRQETECFILGQCLRYPRIIPHVAQALNADPLARGLPYAFTHPALQAAWSFIYDIHKHGSGEILAVIEMCAQWGAMAPLHNLDTPTARAASAINTAKRLFGDQSKGRAA